MQEYNITHFRKKCIEKDFARMNNMQFKAVTKTNGPLLILAGAGSGKTTVLINRIVYMIKYGNAYHCVDQSIPTAEEKEQFSAYLNGTGELPSRAAVNPVRPWEILAITFTNKAAGELKERLESAVPESGNEVWASTFHSTCSKILRRYADRLGYTSNFSIYDTDAMKRLIKDVQKQLKIDDKFLPVKSILGEISHAKDSLITPDEYEGQCGADIRKKQIAKAYHLYQKMLKSYDAMDFDDLIVNTVNLFKQEPDVLEYYQNRFKYIMIDEYQDTNFAQYMFAKLLADKHHNICVVGDDDQSIYRFRGATIENILNFEHQYKDAQVIRLEQNYRSTQIILDAANSVIANNVARKGKNLWTEQKGGDKITVYTASDEQAEARFVADTILENVKNGERFSDHIVLYRMNALSNTIENVFRRSGISYKVVGGYKFFDRKEIRDVLSYLNVINNPADGVSLLRIINEPKRGIGDTTIAHISSIAASVGVPMIDIIRRADEYADLKRSAVKLKEFASVIDELIDVKEEITGHELFELMLDKTGYLLSLQMLGEEGKDRIDNVNELASSIVQYENENDDKSISGFLEEIALITEMESDDGNDDKVVLMTMHGAKGLEFPTVFIIGAEDGIFPGSQSMFNPEDMEEERRLAYVAITRAKKRLYISCASMRMLFGKTGRSVQSRFIGEIPAGLVKKEASMVNDRYVSTEVKIAQSEKFDRPKRPAKYYYADSKPTVSADIYKVGDSVTHKVFGRGMIIKCTPMGNDTLLEIIFDSVGTKKIMANFAKLEKINDL